MPVQLRKSRAETQEMIERVVAQGREIMERADLVATDDDYATWVRSTERWHAYGREALHLVYATDREGGEFYSAATGGILRQLGQTVDEEFGYRREATAAGLNTLHSLLERLELAEEPVASEGADPQGRASVGGDIFLVHGHNEGIKHTVARFLDKVTAPNVVILEEQPDMGRTIIEKFEEHAKRAGYAVVLVTGDDEGRRRGTEDLNPRARQNVILELGFFIGTLGRGHVALLYETGVELPSDIDGVLYLPLDDQDAWKTRLAREMNAARIEIDPAALLMA